MHLVSINSQSKLNSLEADVIILFKGGSISQQQRLSSVTLRVITNAECQATFGATVRATNICTSGEGGRSVCSGDSGGPIALVSGGRRIVVSFSFNPLSTVRLLSIED